MKLQKRILSLLLILCMAIPMCLITVSADEAAKVEPASYDLFCDAFKDLTYDTSGRSKFNKATELVNSLYANGTLKAIPYAFSSASSAFITYSGAKNNTTFVFDGFMQQKVKTGDWVALKFKSPGAGVYSISFRYYFQNQNNSGMVNAYLLSGNVAADKVGALLTENNFIGFADIQTNNTQLQEHTARVSTGTELAANTEYILVLRFGEDLHKPDDDRIDFMLTGLEFGVGKEGGFSPLRTEVVFERPVISAQFYRALNGVNPANGHDMLYLMFKGGDMLVYDVDTDEIVDREDIVMTQMKGSVITPDGHIWICGSGNNIIEYDPSNATMETVDIVRHRFDYALVNEVRHESAGLVYGGDGLLYFGYYGWILSLNPVTGEFKNVSGTQITSDPNLASDAQFPCAGGIVYHEGYLYFGIYGDLNKDQKHTGQLVKFDLATGKPVQFIDVLDSFRGKKYQANYGFGNLCMKDGILYGNFGGRPDRPVLVDITGDEMVRLDSVPGLETDLISAFTAELNGKYYLTAFVDREATAKCLYEYDPATKTFTRMGDIYAPSTLSLANQGIVTIEGNEKLPGKSIMTAQNNSATGEVDLYFYNMETRETVIREGVTKGYGTGVSLTGFEMDPTGRYLYTGGYGCNKIGVVDLQTGDVWNYNTVGHQIDSIVWYDDILWTGNYFDGIINRFDPVHNDSTGICYTLDAVFRNRRMLNGVAGDGKVFFAGAPDNGRSGGVLAWYDIARDLTYIATGPNPENVYYAQTTASFVVWHNAVSHEIETFDLDGDSFYDADIIIDDKGDDDHNNDDVVQHVYGVFKDRVISTMCYVDGYIYGGTTKDNGNNVYYDEGNAQIFVYDVNNMKLLGEYDLTKAIADIEDAENGTVMRIELVTNDPYEKGKFWGVVCDTLFSFTFDHETLTFSVKEELSFGKNMKYNSIGNSKTGISAVFEGEYLYVAFENAGTYMINTSDPSDYNQISSTAAERIERAPDGNLYFITGEDGIDMDIKMWRLAEYSQPLVIKSVQAVIDALPETVTMEQEEQVMTAYKMYLNMIETSKTQINADKLLAAVAALEVGQAAKADQLIEAIGTVTLDSLYAIQTARRYYESIPEAAQAKVTKLSVLEAAEEIYLELKAASEKPVTDSEPDPTPAPAPKNNTMTIVIIAVAAVVLIAAAVAVVLVLKKKKKTE